MTRRETATVTTRTTTHDLSIHGRAGAALFILLACLVTFLVAFSTAGWANYGRFGRYGTEGLWQVCGSNSNDRGYHVATQVMMCLALVGLVIAVILIFLYLFAATVSKYQVLLGLVIDSFITFALMLVSIIVYGAHVKDDVYWSYGVAIISTILCLCAAIVVAIQLHRC